MTAAIRLTACPRCQQERVVVRLDSGEWCCVTCYLNQDQEKNDASAIVEKRTDAR